MDVNKVALKRYANLASKALKKPVIYFLLFILAFFLAAPTYYYIHERGHQSEAKLYGWNYTTSYGHHELTYLGINMTYTAPDKVEAYDNNNATKEQQFSFYITPVAIGFTTPIFLLLFMVLIPPKYKNRYVEVFIAFFAFALFADAFNSLYEFDGGDMWRIAHLFA
ncbi:MAG: hypothetical protein ABIF85_03565 [Nanoarchaeota archaeon]|nr:hypothetical protein [Nanoarchaeota archaeon]MBU4451495.1 hypothetical protein [Nanoarchaeota archaeon]MCG2723854.1 hypothetical protein [archaeon]